MQILREISCHHWDSSYSSAVETQAVNAIENGQILFFPELMFTLLPHEKIFLTPDIADLKSKNISFDIQKNLLRGAKGCEEDHQQLKLFLRRYAEHATGLVKKLLSPYANGLQIGRTSFRPLQIAGRITSYRKDDTRLHVDAFPGTPNQGRRILRVFTNINPDREERVWRVGESFENVAKRFLPLVRKRLPGSAEFLKMLKITKSYRTHYDHIMLHIHDKMKADMQYQSTVEQQEIRFAPGTSWIVQTDHVSHAAMSGQYVLEQTFYLPVLSMVNPELSPLRTLEKLTRKKLVCSDFA